MTLSVDSLYSNSENSQERVHWHQHGGVATCKIEIDPHPRFDVGNLPEIEVEVIDCDEVEEESDEDDEDLFKDSDNVEQSNLGDEE